MPTIVTSPRPLTVARRPALLAVLLAALAGCAGGKSALTGKVTYKGKAIVFGTVVVQGADGLQIPGTINPDGTYRVTGIAAGKALVGVVSRDPGPTAAPKGRVSGKTSRDAEDGPGPADRPRWFALPQKYEDPSRSGLTTTLRPGANQYDIELP
jgi:hypothetical protein